MQQRRPTLRQKAELLYRKYRAILILTNRLFPEERKKIDEVLEDLPNIPLDKIRDRLPELAKRVKELSTHYGVIGSLEDLEHSANVTHEHHPLLYVLKSRIEELFTHYERVLPAFNELSPHARIGIELLGTRKKNAIEVFLLEASLYEDMAALWNTTLEFSESLQLQSDKMKKKQMNALKRATAKAAFSALEGYLNGMAFDIRLTQTVSEKEKIKLSEWDEERSKPKLLRLRDKLLQYPKIAMGEQHPLLDETNCPELAKILEMEQYVRHSLIHPSPQPKEEDSTWSREFLHLQLTIEEVAQLCDLTVELIYKLNEAIQDKFGKVQLWLYRRDKTGKFPSKVFT